MGPCRSARHFAADIGNRPRELGFHLVRYRRGLPCEVRMSIEQRLKDIPNSEAELRQLWLWLGMSPETAHTLLLFRNQHPSSPTSMDRNNSVANPAKQDDEW